MRRFVVVGHDAPVEPGIDLSDIPGSAGRLDVLCRCVTAGLLHSHGIRTDAEVLTVHQDALSVRFDGGSIRNLHPDERSTAARFDGALADADDAVGAIEVESSPGVAVSRRGLADVLTRPGGRVVKLEQGGDPLPSWDPAEDVTFVLSDHRPFQPADDAVLAEFVDESVSLGPVPLHADHAITVVQNYLDTDGYATYATDRADEG